MGDAHVAVVDDRNALYYNPAGLANIQRAHVSGLGLTGGIDNRFFDVLNFVRDHEEQFSDFDTVDQEFYDDLAAFDDRWAAADASAYVDFTRPSFGIGVYSTGRVQFKLDRGVYEPRVYANVIDDIVAVAGGAMPLGRGDLRVGGALKTIWRRQFDRALTAREVVDLDADLIADRLAGADPGFAMDLGVLWSPPASPFSAGAVLRDAAGRVAGESIGAAFDVGGSWRPPVSAGVIRSLVIAADLRDTFSDAAFGTKIRVGAEMRIPVLALRAGLHQGYPTVGASLGSPVFNLDYAFFGRELGEVPGAEPQYLHALEARLGF